MAWIKPHLTASCMELFCLSPDMPPRFTLAFTTSPHNQSRIDRFKPLQ